MQRFYELGEQCAICRQIQFFTKGNVRLGLKKNPLMTLGNWGDTISKSSVSFFGYCAKNILSSLCGFIKINFHQV